MNEPAGPLPSRGRVLVGVLLAAAVWDVWGLVRHPGFQPAPWLRIAAPILALLIGGGFMRLVALARASVDAEREFERGGKALFMGFAMVAATLVAWLLVSQALPATLTALTGAPASEAGLATHRVPETSEVDCHFRLVVASAAPESGSVPRPLDECVAEAVWRSATEGGPVTLQLVRGALGAELVGVAAAH